MDSYNDQITLQLDIDYLHDWPLNNNMKFHPSKCNPPLINDLPK